MGHRDFRGIKIKGSLNGLSLKGADFNGVDISKQRFGRNTPYWYLKHTPGWKGKSIKTGKMRTFINLLKAEYYGKNSSFLYKLYLFIWGIFNPTIYNRVDTAIKQYEKPEQINNSASSNTPSRQQQPKQPEDFHEHYFSEIQDLTLKRIFDFLGNYYSFTEKSEKKSNFYKVNNLQQLNNLISKEFKKVTLD